MQVAIYLLKSCWVALGNIPLFDTGITFLDFCMALLVFDVLLILLRHVLRKESDTSNSSNKKVEVKE